MARSAMTRQVLGWAAVSISTAFACLWAFWGSIENFHEAWYYPSIWRNIGLMFVQYLSPMLFVLLVSVLALRWPPLAVPLLTVGAIAGAWYFSTPSHAAIVLIAFPLAFLGVLYHFGRPQPRRWAWKCVIGLPLLTAVVCGAYPGWRATHRFDDGNYGMRRIEGNGVTLIWSPEGPGWPTRGVSWHEAMRSCTYLSADGRSLEELPQNVWRLPTIDEAVRSMVFRGANAGGTWDPLGHRAQYRVMPDKDSPIWKVHSQVIYWWTSTEVDEIRADYITDNGYVLAVPKRFMPGSLAYRCVCEPSKTSIAPTGHE